MKSYFQIISLLSVLLLSFHQESFADTEREVDSQNAPFKGVEASYRSYNEYADQTIAEWLDHLQTGSEVNNFTKLVAHPDADSLVPAEVEDFDHFRNSPNYSTYCTQANQIVAAGGLIKEFYLSFSGLGGTAKGMTDGKTKYSYMKEKEVFPIIPSYLPIPIEIRDILQYRLQLEKQAKEHQVDPLDYVQKAKLILHVTDDNKSDIERDLKEFDWFGFSPENIVILVQPLTHLYRISNGKVCVDDTVQRLGGHGYAFSQIIHPDFGSAYTFHSDGTPKILTSSALSYFREKGARYLLSAGVHDLTQLTSASFEPDALALVLYLFDRGHDVVLEMVGNPERRIGAYWVRNGQNKPFVIHTRELLQTNNGKQRPLERLIDEGVLYSRFVHYIKLDALENIVSQHMLPLSIEEDDTDATFRLYMFADDICRIPGINAAAFNKKGKITHTFKFDEDLPEALAFISRQDTDPEFKTLAKKIYLKRASKHMNEPLQFITNWVTYPWGGSRIAEFKNIPAMPQKNIGETWEISAQPRNPSHLVINEQLQPLTLEDLMKDDQIAEKIVGSRVFGIAKNWFPILYKFLDASEFLSVQVHPSTQVAKELGEGEPGKSETWVVLDAKPNAYICAGLKENASYAELEKVIQENEDIIPFLKKYPVKKGEVLGNAPGIIHSIGAGVFVAEIQGNSDITYRIYDHKRIPKRPLHVPQALQSIDIDLSKNFEIRATPRIEQNTLRNSQVELLAKNPYYEVRRANIKFYDSISVASEGDFQIVSVIGGRVQLWAGSAIKLLRQGQTVLVPALSNPITLVTKDHDAQVLFIKPGNDPRPVPKSSSEDIHFIDPKDVLGSVNLAISVGGTKLTLGAVCSEGLIETGPRIEWKKILETKNRCSPTGFIDLIVDEIEKLLISLESKGIHRNRIQEIGLAWPGPGEYAQGIVSATFLPGFDKYPMGSKLKEEIEKRLSIDINVRIILDAWADAFGEMALNSNLKNWTYLNVATGVAAGIVKNSKIVDEYQFPGKPSVKSGLGQIGRHLIRLTNGKWEYRPTPNGEIPPMVKGEKRLTEYVGGPGLAKRFVDYVEMKTETTSIDPNKFFETSVSKLREAIDRRDAAAIRYVLEIVQKQAQSKNELAIEMISEVGRDIGSALRVFADAFPQEFFYNHMIIGGGIGENLGKDIPATKSNTDIFIYNIIQASQIPNISRTKVNVNRELLAFRPYGFNAETKLLIFDMDDTLYDSSRLKKMHKEAIYQLYAAHHHVSNDEACQIVENKRKELAACQKPSGDRNVIEALGFTFEQMVASKDRYIGDQSRYVEPLNGLRERLLECKQHYSLVLATNNVKGVTLSILKKLGLDDVFEKIYTQDETGLHKPDQRLFELIGQEMKVPYHLSVSIGDSMAADIEPARKLGMQALLVKGAGDLISKIDMMLLNPKSSDRIMTFQELDRLYGLSMIDGFSQEHQKIAECLLRNKQQHLFEDWDAPKIANEKKLGFFNEFLQLEKNYPNGVEGYLVKHKELIHEWKTGSSSFPGNELMVPQKDLAVVALEKKPGNIDSDFIKWEAKGLQSAHRLAVLLTAGGTGKRLEYNGIKIALPTESIFLMSNLERYGRWIKAVQDESNRINRIEDRIPFFIMTSEDTHEKTLQFLEKNQYFGLDKTQFHVFKQSSVPVIVPRTGKMCRDFNDKYRLMTGGCGYGEVHKLMHAHGFAAQLAKEGRYILLVQDTNPQITNGALVALAQTIENRWDLNFIATAREAKEATHCIVDFYQPPKNSLVRTTISYSLADSTLRRLGKGGDVADPQTGYSSYPGYSGVILMSAVSYDSVLQKTKGILESVVKPKGEDDRVRLEYQAEDITSLLSPGMIVGVSYFKDKRLVFSPVKNSSIRAADLQSKGNYPDAQGTGEADFIKENRRLLKFAGADIKVDGKPFEVKFKKDNEQQGYYFENGAKVVLSPDFAPTREIAIKKISGHMFISADSVFAVRGKDVSFKNIYLAGGALIVDVPNGISLHVHDISLSGDGWQYKSRELPMHDESVCAYEIVKSPNAEVIDTRSEEISKIFREGGPGAYELTQSDGRTVCRRLDSKLSMNEEKVFSETSNGLKNHWAAFIWHIDPKLSFLAKCFSAPVDSGWNFALSGFVPFFYKIRPNLPVGFSGLSDAKRPSLTVFGASGDIGSALVSRLDQQGRFVNAIFRSPASIDSYFKRTDHSLPEKQCLIVENFLNRATIESILSNTDVFYLLAAALALGKSQEAVYKDIAVNAFMPIKIMKTAERVRPDMRFVFGSSWVIYGVNENNEVAQWIEKALAFIEDHHSALCNSESEEELMALSRQLVNETQLPSNVPAYAVAKLLVEKYLTHCKLSNFVAVRISSSYGAGSLSGRSIQRMIEARFKGETVSMHQEARDYIALQDLAEIFIQAGLNQSLPRRSFIDAASGQIVSPQEIWDLIEQLTPDSSGSIRFAGSPSRQKPMNLEWSEKLISRDFIPFVEGLKRQVEWMQEIDHH